MSHNSKHVSSLDSSNSSKIKRQDSEHSNTTVAPRVNSYRRSSRVVGAKKVQGFDTQLISLEKMIQQRQSSDQFKAVAIVGKRGVGKTTLCQALFNRVQADFLPRIWVCMSWKPTEYGDRKTTTVKRMLTCLGVDDETIQSISDSVPEADRLSSLLYALHLQLTGKKYLIVLDDAIGEGDDADNKKKKGDDAIKEGDDADQKKKKADAFKERNKWLADLDSPITEKEKWGKCLAFGLPKGHGGTVIVTSRDENLAKVMVGEKNLLHLRPLSDPKSCSFIYNDMIDIQELNNDPEQKEFLKKCAGLPLAAAMMGKIKSEELVKAAKEAEEKAAKEAAEKSAKEAAEKAEKEPAKKMEPESPISSKDEENYKIEELPTETKPIQPDEVAKSSKDDKKIKSEEVPAGEKHIQQQEKDARSSIGSKDDEQIKSEEHPAEAEPEPHQEGAAHNEIIEAASGTN
ncbi:putative disease resistance protein At5g45440 [Castanea sativa]|uniref:putative disease resistance protein At5g45440 n=1 Tax=Castanea sativa TaxID=21020 RepID=UPI003F64A5ED